MKEKVIFKSTYRAKFNEIDPYGVMNNLYYQKYFFEHRFDGLRESFGLNIKQLSKLPVFFLTKSCLINYKHPIVSDSEFTITSSVVRWGDCDAEVFCEMFNAKGRMLANCTIILTCVDAKTMKIVTWPEDIKNLFFIEKNDD